MQLYYHPDLTAPVVTLSADEAEHCLRSMRHRDGDEVYVTDGRGTLAKGRIVAAQHNECAIEITGRQEQAGVRPYRLHLAVAPTKNPDRMEWMLEKCVEVGVEQVSFLVCDRSERPRLNMARLQRVAIAAMKQSCTTLLPKIELTDFNAFIRQNAAVGSDKFIAWCDGSNELQLDSVGLKHDGMILLVGPEGDFSGAEIRQAQSAGYVSVKLGERRLRTETAGLYGCIVFDIRCRQRLESKNH